MMTKNGKSVHSQIQKRTIQNLRKVLFVNSRINSTLEVEKLLTIIVHTAAEVMQSKAASLMLIDEKTQDLVFQVALGPSGSQLKEHFRVKMGEGIAGRVAESGKSAVVKNVKKTKQFARRFDEATGFVTKSILCVPVKSKDKTIGVLEAINPIRREGFGSLDQDLFETFANQAGIAIENARYHEEILKQERAKQELKIAHQIQQNFLPDLKKVSFGIDLAAVSIPAREVGGDFYDVIPLGDARYVIAIGDVSGKGVPASLYMVRAISELRFLAPHQRSISGLMKALNEALVQNTSFGMFVTLLVMILDRKKRTLEFSSAGHHPILKRNSHTSTVESVGCGKGGVPVGLDEGAVYEEESIPIEAGDVFILYTDGIIEARNTKGEEFTLERLTKTATSHSQDAQGYANAILQSVQDFTKDAEQHDDMTALALVIPDAP